MLGGFANTQSSGASGSNSMSEPAPKKRRTMRRGDYAQAQLMLPHRPSTVEQIDLNKLWAVVSKGNEWVQAHSYLCDGQPERVGVAISQFAQCLKHAIMHFREKRVQACFSEAMIAKVKDVVDPLYGHLDVLDGGALKGKGFAALSTQKTPSMEEINKSAEYVYRWLKQPTCDFRTYLARLSGGSIIYQSQCEEKVMRAYLNTNITLKIFQEAACARLSGSEAEAPSQTPDDSQGW